MWYSVAKNVSVAIVLMATAAVLVMYGPALKTLVGW